MGQGWDKGTGSLSHSHSAWRNNDIVDIGVILCLGKQGGKVIVVYITLCSEALIDKIYLKIVKIERDSSILFGIISPSVITRFMAIV